MEKQHMKKILLVTIFTLIYLQTNIPSLADHRIVERFISLILIAAVTEFLFEIFGIKGDNGILAYSMGFVYPPLFLPASAILHQHTSAIPLYSDLQAMILGNHYTTRYRGDANFREIHSEHMAIEALGDIETETRKSYYLRETIVFIAILLSFLTMHESAGAVLSIGVFAVYTIVKNYIWKDEIIRTQNTRPIVAKQGVYAIESSNLWTDTHIGVGYLADGTFTTKYHVTNAQPIVIDGNVYSPCYYNTKADIVAYGAPPAICDVNDGDKVIVALSGPHSDVIVSYSSTASVNSQGYIMFAGKKSIPGTSGSPFFKRITQGDEVSYKFAGCIGWATRTTSTPDNEIVEVALNTSIGVSESIGRGEIVQHISHPGSGKTRNITRLIQQGINLYGRTYVVGPTRGVSYELVSAYEDNPIEGLVARVLIKDTTRSRAVSKVTISTHATILGMLLRKDTTVMQPGLWIIDEAHFADKATQALKHYLRDRISKEIIKGSLYEMTATAYDIKAKKWCYSEGSNYPITDTIMSKSQMIEAMTQDERKCIVFVTSIKGREKTSSQKLKEHLQSAGKKCIEINRANFTKAYPEAKKGDFDVALVTTIAECGVNLNVEVCYDFQESPKPMVYRWDDIRITTEVITKSQYVQRRGRVGRTCPGEYIAPKSKFTLADVHHSDAMYLDLALFIKNFDIEPMEPVQMMDVAENYSCTHEQIMYLFAEGEEAAINSPLALKTIVDSKGKLRDRDDIMKHLTRWNRGNAVFRTAGKVECEALYWDDRDSAYFWEWKNLLQMVNPDDTITKDSIFNSLRNTIFKVGRSLRHRGVRLNREQFIQREFETSGTDEDIEEANLPSTSSQ